MVKIFALPVELIKLCLILVALLVAVKAGSQLQPYFEAKEGFNDFGISTVEANTFSVFSERSAMPVSVETDEELRKIEETYFEGFVTRMVLFLFSLITVGILYRCFYGAIPRTKS